MQHLLEVLARFKPHVLQGPVETGDRPTVHLLVWAVAAVDPHDGRLVPIGIGVGRRPPEGLGPVCSESLAVLGMESVAEGVADYLVRHHPGVPRLGEAEQALAAACGLIHALHVPKCAKADANVTDSRQDALCAFRLADADYVYVWVDGIHLKVRLAQDKVCLLVMIGVRADGTKELIALDDGHRESTESWADLLRSAKRRGMAAPVLAVGDGALGFWAAVREVFPQTREQRCWFYKIANVLNALPKSAQPGAKAAIAEIWNAEDREHAAAAAHAFATDYGAKWPKAVAKITDDLDELLAFYDYPAEHWIHLRTTNPVESTFATVRLRQRVPKGPGSRAAGVAMAFKLIESAQARWRTVNAPHLVALVRAGAKFERGQLVERPDGSGGDQQVA